MKNRSMVSTLCPLVSGDIDTSVQQHRSWDGGAIIRSYEHSKIIKFRTQEFYWNVPGSPTVERV